MAAKHKVIGVGFQKTGTSSLGLALEKLGYRVASYDQFRGLLDVAPADMGPAIRNRAQELLEHYDAFKDTPWPILFRELDEWLPGAKFILVTRDADRWIRSVVTDFGGHPNPMHEYIYGVGAPLGNEEAFVRRYEAHNAEVIEHFKHRPGDFLHLHLDRGEVRWEAICRFLGHPVPDIPWPHANTAKDKRWLMRRMWLKSQIQRRLPAWLRGSRA